MFNTHPQKQYKMPLTSKFIPQGVHNISNKELLEFTHKSEDKKPEWIPYSIFSSFFVTKKSCTIKTLPQVLQSP